MANWKEYTTKTTPEDADEIMIADSKANVSKRTPFSGLWNWIAGKLATAVIFSVGDSKQVNYSGP